MSFNVFVQQQMTVFVRKLHLFFSNLMTIPHLWRKNTMDVDENEKKCRINVLETTTHQLIDIYQNLLLKSVLGLVNFLWVAGHLLMVGRGSHIKHCLPCIDWDFASCTFTPYPLIFF